MPEWEMLDFVTIAAILIGPIGAVLVTRFIDHLREKRTRKLDIFKTLMRTRRENDSPEHIGALNLIEIEFSDDQEILQNWKNLFAHFGDNHPRADNETVTEDMSIEEKGRRDGIFFVRLHDERQKLLAKLLHAMAKRLGFKIEQLEIFEGGYLPQGVFDMKEQQRVIRQYLIDLYRGLRLVPVGVIDYVEKQTPVKETPRSPKQ